jgi:hypothetical protein
LPKYLWLPRDPLRGVNLDDTVEWRAHALVSSEGGSGRVGADVELPIYQDQDHAGDPHSDQTPSKPVTSTKQHSSDPLSLRMIRNKRLQGVERIKVAQQVAAQIEKEDASSPRKTPKSATSEGAHQNSGGRRYVNSPSLFRVATERSNIMVEEPEELPDSETTAEPQIISSNQDNKASVMSRRTRTRMGSLFSTLNPSSNVKQKSVANQYDMSVNNVTISQSEALVEEVLHEERINRERERKPKRTVEIGDGVGGLKPPSVAIQMAQLS